MLGAWPDTETLVLAFAERERTDQLLTKSPSSSARAPLAPAPRAMREATAAAATTKRRGMITPTAARKDTASGSATFPRRSSASARSDVIDIPKELSATL